MITKDGKINLGNESLLPCMSEEKFRNLSIFSEVEEWSRHEDFHSYRVFFTYADKTYIAIVQFREGILVRVSLSERQGELKDSHADLPIYESMLDSWLGKKRFFRSFRKFRWGKVQAVYDPRSNSSSIVVSFE